METRLWRRRTAGWGLLLVGGAMTIYSVSLWGIDAPFITALSAIGAVGGALLISGRENAYYYLLPVVSVIALLQALGYYLNYGVTVLTLLFGLVGVVSLAKGVQAYRESK